MTSISAYMDFPPFLVLAKTFLSLQCFSILPQNRHTSSSEKPSLRHNYTVTICEKYTFFNSSQCLKESAITACSYIRWPSREAAKPLKCFYFFLLLGAKHRSCEAPILIGIIIILGVNGSP